MKSKRHHCPTCGAALLFALSESITLTESFGKYIELLEQEGREASYLRTLRQRFRDYIAPHFKAIAVDAISTYHVQVFYQELLKVRLSSKTVKHVLDTLRGYLNHMQRMEAIQRMPLMPVVKVKYAEKRWLDEKQQATVLAELPQHHRIVFEVLMETGCRPGEVCALRRRDLRDDGLMIERARGERGGVKATKTGSARLAPLSAELMERLHLHVSRMLPEAWLFLSAQGVPYTQPALYNIWRRCTDKLGIRISLYQGVRHSRVSQMRSEMEGKMRRSLADALGHRHSTTTMKHYALPEGRKV